MYEGGRTSIQEHHVMIIDGIGPFSSESENKTVKNALTPISSTGCNALKFEWLTQIAAHRQQVSTLMHKIINSEASPSERHSSSVVEFHSSFAIRDRLKIQKKNLLHSISNLILASSSIEEVEERDADSIEETESHLVSWLKEKGYLALSEKLERSEGYPWNEFKKIRSPILIEQLVDIYLLCKHKKIKERETTKILNFALYLANLACSSNLKNEYTRSYEIINDAKQILGQLIYLINQDSAQAIEAIDQPHYPEVLESIREAFSNKIQDICERLQNHYLIHDATQLQDPEVALHTRIPIEIGKALLTKIGTINVGIIDSLSDIFLSHENQQINYEINLSHALTLLQHSPRLRAKFEKISIPNSTKNPSNSIIRATLGLSATEEISSLDARLTVLIAILSHLRQGGDRSCFAVSLAIEILSSHLGFCFKDLRQLLEEGKLTRRVKGVKKDIPFVKRISDENLHKEIAFNVKGKVIVKGQVRAPLWEAPGLIAACQAIGVVDPKETILAVIKKLPPLENKQSYKMEIRKLIAKICKQSSSNPSNLDALFNQACFAFSSQTTQPLLKVWENAIANMAEAEEGSMIKTAILEAILDALQFRLGELSIPPSPVLQRFFLSIQKLLYERIHLQYDPTIGAPVAGNQAIEGGFVLYNGNKRIDKEESFRLFLSDILNNASSFVRSGISSDTQNEQLNQAIEILIPYLNSTEFMVSLLARYHPSNKLAISQLTQGHALNYNLLHYTPWLTQTGNDSKALLKTYLESEKPIHSEKFIISGAEEALINIIEICKQMSDQEKELYLNNPNKLKPLCILGKHRLPFMAGNPSLSSAWQQDCSTKKWMKKYVLNPGKQIAESIIEKETQNKLIQYLKKILSHELSDETIRIILDHVQTIEDGLTIKQYRTRLLKICLGVQPLPRTLAERLARQIDTALCDSLTPEFKKKLENSAVHFADTNWCNGIQDLHFCFAVNPGTGKLELWEAQSNGSHLTALDQNYWLFNQKWEFLTMPEDLIPDDSSYLDTH